MADPTPKDEAIDIDKLDDVSGGGDGKDLGRMVTHGQHEDSVIGRDATHGQDHDIVGGLNRDILHRP